MRDKYDDAIAYLTEHPEQIHQVWNNPEKYPAGCLFEYAGDPHARDIGCLTLIRGPNSWIARDTGTHRSYSRRRAYPGVRKICYYC